MSPLNAVLVAWLVMAFLMALLWLVQKRTHNAGIVDVAWSFGTSLCAVGFALTASGDPTRRALVAFMAGGWGLRLGVHLANRVFSEEEDGRYRMLREKWGSRIQPMMFGFYQLQAFWAVMFALPMMAASSNRAAFSALDGVAVALWLVSIFGEGIADWQLARFRADPTSHGRVCREGLWGWSRHPNYFFEWIQWWAYILLAANTPLAWLAWGGAIVMLFFLTKVTGIPMTEARALLSRGDAYRKYQQEVSVFVPAPPRRGVS